VSFGEAGLIIGKVELIFVVASGFIVLTGGSAIATVGLAHGNRDFLGNEISLSEQLVGNFVDVLVMGIRHDKDMAGVINPPFRCDEGGDGSVFINNIFGLSVAVALTAGHKAEWALVVGRSV
jgi:hypothetical protein